MYPIISRFVTLFLLGLSIASLAGCGGGGGGGGGGSGGNSSLSVNTNAINFSAIRYAELPAAQAFTIRWSGSNVAGVVVGVPPNQTVPTWLEITTSGTASPVGMTVAVNTTDLPDGVYTVTLRLVSGDSDLNVIDIVDIPLTYTVTERLATSTTELTFNHVVGSAQAPASQDFDIVGPAVSWSASADQPWTSLNAALGTTPATMSVSVDPTNLPVGTHSGVITVVNINDSSETVDVNVVLQITLPAVQTSTAALTFSGINGTNLASQSVSFSLDNMQDSDWTAAVSDPWIVLDANSWSAPDSVAVDIDASSTSLASGNYSGEITFSTSYQGNSITKVVPVSLMLTRATLSVQSGDLNFQGGPATDFTPQDVTFSINTATNQYPWQISLVTATGTGWLEASVASGSVSQAAQTSAISINTTDQTGDVYTGSVELSVGVNGDTLTQSLPVELVLEPHRLFVADNGVALVSAPGISNLSHTVTVSDNRLIATPWTAASDQPWLSVSGPGVTDSDLVLTADPSALTPEMTHYATVTINSSASTVTNSGQELIRVGLYVTNTAPVSTVSTALPAVGLNRTGLVADPVRPYVYITHGGSDVEAYNIYTGALVSTISNAGLDLRNMAISTDGDMLYMLDYSAKSIVSVDLRSNPLVANAAWTDPVWSDCACSNAFIYSSLDYTRVNGREVLIGGASDIIDAITGARLYPSTSLSFLSLQVVADITANGSVMYSANTNSSGHTAKRRVLKHSELNDSFAVTETHSRNLAGFNRGMSTDPSGDNVYRACWHPGTQIEVYNGDDLSPISLISSGTNGGALYGPDGLLYCARYYSDLSAPGSGDVWSVNPATNTIVSEFNVAGEIRERMFDISGDGQRLITRSNNQDTLTLTAIP